MARAPSSFVEVADLGSGPALALSGRPFRFVLANAYYLQEEAARGRVDRVDEVLGKCARLGARVVRTWAFNDDPDKADSGMQRGPGLYAEVGLSGLDRVLERARAHGIRLILPLVNYWNAYGGVRQWLAWQGVGDAFEGDARFFTDERLRSHYAGHVARLLRRVNPLTGDAYGDDPTVLAWELMNEPRGRGLDPEGRALAAWVGFAAREVKRHARQLVSVGDEGEEVSPEGYDAQFFGKVGASHLFSPLTGTSFSRHLECPFVDLASCHFYPEKYGIRAGAEEEAGCAWIEGHTRRAAAAGRPLIVGELGLANEGRPGARFALSERRRIYARWLAQARSAGAAGAGMWLLAHDDRPDEWDDFTFYVRSDAPLDDPRNRYADLIADAAAML
jgi:mannan endo-1,4-beta-mannosidase